MDAFAVSIVSGVTIKNLKTRHAFKIAMFFGLFQAIMPILGFYLGLSLKNVISNIDHWVAFTLLFCIGTKMIYESFKLKTESRRNPLNIYILFILSIATSIDAFVIGITFAFLKISIFTPVIIIGAVTFALSFLGCFLGKRIGHFFESKIEALGGIILIIIGSKILIEHLIN